MQGLHGAPPPGGMYGPPSGPGGMPPMPGPGGNISKPQGATHYQNGQQGDHMHQISHHLGHLSMQNTQQNVLPGQYMPPASQQVVQGTPQYPSFQSSSPGQGMPQLNMGQVRPPFPQPSYGPGPQGNFPLGQTTQMPAQVSTSMASTSPLGFNRPPLPGGPMMRPMVPGQQTPAASTSDQFSGVAPPQQMDRTHQQYSQPHPGFPQNAGNMPLPGAQVNGAPPGAQLARPPVGYRPPGYPPAPGQPSAPGLNYPQVAGPGLPSNPPHMAAGLPQMPLAGMPSMPGQPFAGPAGPVPSQQKRLDPDQMPSPIQVIVDDAKTKGGVFATGQRGTVPPLVTTEFICQDQGNCNPRFLRSTMYNVPVSSEMMKQCKIPFGLVCSPYAKTRSDELSPPVVNLGELGPIRCKRCRAYMSPHMQFIDGGRRFSCPFCTCVTDVPQEYFAHLDHTGKRTDTYERAELCLGSYEIVATKDYCKNGVAPKPPAFIFMIDVSYNSIKTGLVNLLCQHLKTDILPHLPKEAGMEESEIRVGFVTYSNVLHFYNVRGNLVQPQMMVVGDVEDVFVPVVEGFLVKLSEAETVIESLLEQIPELFAESRETEIILGPIIQAGLDALKSAGCPGKLFIFHTSLPTLEAPGKLKNRDDRKLLGTEKEKSLLTPQIPFYTTLAQECVTHGCGVDLFLFPNSYVDLASIGEICRITGGDIYKYDYFTAESHGTKFLNDLKMAVSKPIAFDCIVRVRTSTGVRAVDFLGNFYMSNTTDIEIAVLDSDKAFCVEIKHDDKLNEGDTVYIQVAMLFTSMAGQRKLRIHNLALGVCSLMADLFKNVELDALINFMSKAAIRSQLQKTPKDVREEIMMQCAEILACYRRNCASSTAAGQLILPESMKLLPLYTNCVLKSDALQASAEVSTDSRSHLMHSMNALDVPSSVPYFYPRLIPLHNADLTSDVIPTPIRCTIEKLSDTGAYLLENGFCMFLWLGFNLSAEFLEDIFGVSSIGQVNIESGLLLELDNARSQRVNDIIRKVRSQRTRFMKLTIVRQRDKLDPWFQHYLVEDKGANGSASYVDYLCHIHKEIRGILS